MLPFIRVWLGKSLPLTPHCFAVLCITGSRPPGSAPLSYTVFPTPVSMLESKVSELGGTKSLEVAATQRTNKTGKTQVCTKEAQRAASRALG